MFEEKLTVGSKMTWGIWWILMRAGGNLKICTLICYSCRKCVMLKPKTYTTVMYNNTEEWWKNWRGTELRFEIWHEEFGYLWPKTRKSQNLHFNGLLLTKICNVWATYVRRSYAFEASFGGKTTCGFKNDTRNLVNFTGTLKILKICTLRL